MKVNDSIATTQRDHIEEAVGYAGSVVALAKALGIAHSTVSTWLKRGVKRPSLTMQVKLLDYLKKSRRQFPSKFKAWSESRPSYQRNHSNQSLKDGGQP